MDIINYNFYHFINKNGGYVLRFKNDLNSFCALLTWIDYSKISEQDKENYKFLNEKLVLKIGERKKLMDFKIYVSDARKDGSFPDGGYSIPKIFIFPKWNGREPIAKPTINFWQEK